MRGHRVLRAQEMHGQHSGLRTRFSTSLSALFPELGRVKRAGRANPKDGFRNTVLPESIPPPRVSDILSYIKKLYSAK